MLNRFQNPNLVLKNGVFLGLRFFLVLFLAFFTTRITLQVLGDEKFGIYNIVGGIISVFAIVSLPVRDSIQRFLNVEFTKEEKDPNLVFCTTVRIVIYMIVVITVLYETIGLYFINYVIHYPREEHFAVNVIFQITALANIFGFANLPYLSLLFARENMEIPAICEIIGAVIKLIFLYVIPFIPMDALIPYSSIFLITNLLLYGFYRCYCEKKYSECRLSHKYDKTLQGSMLRFSGWSFVEAVAGITLTYVSNIFINIFGGVLYNTAYGISKQLQNTVVNFTTNVLKASEPQITSSTTINNDLYRNQLVMTTVKVSFLGAFFVYIAFHFYGILMLNLWLEKVPDYVFEFCDLSLLGIVFTCVSQPLRALILATGRIKGYFLAYGIISAIAMVLMFGFLKMGAPVIFVMYILLTTGIVSFFLAIIVVNLVTTIKYVYFIRNILGSMITLIIITIIYSIINNNMKEDHISFLLSVFISFLVLIIMGYFVAFNDNEREKTKEIVNKVINRFKK